MDLRPKQIVQSIPKKWPNVWQDIKRFRSAKGKDLPDWPDWCYVPLAAGIAIATYGDDAKLWQALLDPQLSPSVIVAAATWRISQGVYRFDADLYNMLVAQPLDGNLPCQTLTRLPEWCVYIETLDATFDGNTIIGFWAHLEHDTNNGRMELRLVLMSKAGTNIPVPIHLGDWTIEEGLRRMQAEADKQSKIHMRPQSGPRSNFTNDISPLVQLVLYLCAANTDLTIRPAHPNTRKRMSGQVDIAKEPRVWMVGERIGAAVRKHRNLLQQTSVTNDTDASSKSHAPPRPHIRRAHWHHFWIGPKAGDRQLMLRWLPPIPVGYDDDNYSGPVVIHKVHDYKEG